jgi:hypothetical protein
MTGTTHATIISVFITIYQESNYSLQSIKGSMDRSASSSLNIYYLSYNCDNWELDKVEGFSSV